MLVHLVEAQASKDGMNQEQEQEQEVSFCRLISFFSVNWVGGTGNDVFFLDYFF